jgi:hypothetical protein
MTDDKAVLIILTIFPLHYQLLWVMFNSTIIKENYMKNLFKVLILITIVGVTLFSCTSFQFSGAQITREIPSYTTVGNFDITVKVNEFLGASGGANLANVTADAMDTAIYDAIQREIQKFTGDGAVNIEIEYKATFINMLLNSFTFGIYAPATARISGVVVKYN